MKKFLFLLFLFVVGVNAFAQKSYVILIGSSTGSMNIHGDRPECLGTTGSVTLTNAIKLLSEDGYILDKVSSHAYATGDTSATRVTKDTYIFAFSKDKQTSTEVKGIEIESSDDSDIREVARYNLQGMPINEHEKGIQVIVYSNYTTKTVIVE